MTADALAEIQKEHLLIESRLVLSDFKYLQRNNTIT